MSEKSADRIIHYDLLRIAACFSVVMLHTSAQLWYDYPINSTTWLICNSWDGLVRFGVPIFVMISGAVFLKGTRPLDVKRLYVHNILRLVVMYILWCLVYALWDCSKFDMRQAGFKAFINEWISGRYHLWFLPMLVGLYVLLPILRSWVEHAEKKNVQYFLGLFVVFQIGRESLRVLFAKSPMVLSLINTTKVEMVCSYMGYFVLGYYIAQYGIPKKLHKWIYLAGALGCIANVALGNMLSLKAGEARGDVYDSYTFFTFCIAVALFLLFQEKLGERHFRPSVEKCIIGMSADTLGIYLMHVGLLELLKPIEWELFTSMPLVGIPLVAVFCFVICLAVSALLRRIPVVGRYLC